MLVVKRIIDGVESCGYFCHPEQLNDYLASVAHYNPGSHVAVYYSAPTIKNRTFPNRYELETPTEGSHTKIKSFHAITTGEAISEYNF